MFVENLKYRDKRITCRGYNFTAFSFNNKFYSVFGA